MQRPRRTRRTPRVTFGFMHCIKLPMELHTALINASHARHASLRRTLLIAICDWLEQQGLIPPEYLKKLEAREPRYRRSDSAEWHTELALARRLIQNLQAFIEEGLERYEVSLQKRRARYATMVQNSPGRYEELEKAELESSNPLGDLITSDSTKDSTNKPKP